jgi:zeta-carotene desaturase
VADRRVVVVGGGLAGMAAALALQSHNHHVTLIEARKTLGGRAGSFQDPQTGEILDNCQHVLLGCCANLIDFYRRIGADKLIHWEKTLHFVDPRGGVHCLRATPGLPAPLHLALSGITFGALPMKQRFKLAGAMSAMFRLGPVGRAKLANISFGQWLDEQGKKDDLIDAFYEIVLVSALNEQCRRASAAYALQVFQESLLAHSEAYVMGTPACPLGQLYEKFPLENVRLQTRMTALRFAGNRITGVEVGDEFLQTDAVVLAVNYPALEKWIPDELSRLDARFSRLGELESVPILGAHLWFDRPVLEIPHAALLGGPLQWLFRKDSEGKSLHGVISAARDWVNRPKEECLELFAKQIRDTFPAARDAKLQRGVIVIEKRATYSPLPGVDALRPDQSPPPGGIENLYLAGDYTRTGWPATMEGAVRSGYLAAQAICGEKCLVPDLKPQWPACLLGWKT